MPAALLMRCWRVCCVLFAGAIVAAGPIMGGQATWRGITGNHDRRGALRIITCNAGGDLLHQEEFHRLVLATDPDVIFIQEGSHHINDDLRRDGWNTTSGPFLVASRFPVQQIDDGLDYRHFGHAGRVARYTLDTPQGPLTLYHVHLPTPRRGFEGFIKDQEVGVLAIKESIGIRERASDFTRRWFGPLDSKAIVAGDFNMPVESTIFRRHWSDLQDAFCEAGLGWGYTKFTRKIGARIDHVLAGSAWSVKNAWVGPDVGSDHRPVVVDLDLAEGAR